LEQATGIFVALIRLRELKKAGVASCVMKILKLVRILIFFQSYAGLLAKIVYILRTVQIKKIETVVVLEI
jgi:hypothetical protein